MSYLTGNLSIFGFPTENQGIAGGVTFQVGGGDAEAGDDRGVDVFLAFGKIDVFCQIAHGDHGAAFVLEVFNVSLEQLEAGGAVGVDVRHAVVNKHTDFPTARLAKRPAECLACKGNVFVFLGKPVTAVPDVADVSMKFSKFAGDEQAVTSLPLLLPRKGVLVQRQPEFVRHGTGNEGVWGGLNLLGSESQ